MGCCHRHRDDPVMFLGYWNREQEAKEILNGDWWSAGDIGYRDEEDYLWFVGRKDDVISSAGHGIGPGEIEDCMLKHPAVLQAAAVGSPDELRGEIVKRPSLFWPMDSRHREGLRKRYRIRFERVSRPMNTHARFNL